MSVFGKTFQTRAELGRAIQQDRPSLMARDPVEVADTFLASKYADQVTVLNNVKGYGDISPVETLSNIPSSVMKVGGDTLAGIVDMITSPYESAANMLSVGQGMAEKASRAVGVPIDIANKSSEQAAQAMVDQFTNSLSPEGIQSSPAEGIANIASVVSPRALLKTLSAARTGGAAAGAAAKASKAARIASRAAESAPISNTIGVAYDAVRAGARAAGRKYRDFEAEVVGPNNRGGLLDQMTGAMLGFMSGTGPREQALFEKYVRGNQAAMDNMAAAIDKLKPGSRRATKEVHDVVTLFARGIRDEHHAERAALNAVKENAPGLDLTLRDIGSQAGVSVGDIARSELQGRLADYGVRIEPVNTDYIEPATLPSGQFEVVFDERMYPQVYGDNGPTGHYGPVARTPHTGPKVTTNTVMGPSIGGVRAPMTRTTTSLHAYDPPKRLEGNLSIVQQEIEDIANLNGDVTLRDLDDRRQRLDQTIDMMPNAADGTPTPAKRMAMAVRTSLSDAIRQAAEVVSPEYGRALDRYARHLTRQEEMRQLFHLRHDALDRNGRLIPGKTNQQQAANAIYNVGSQSEGNFPREEYMLRIARRLGPDGDSLVPRVLAGSRTPYLGGTLTGRAETAGGVRRAGAAASGIGASLLLGTGVGMGTASLMAGALATIASGATMSMLYSPRLSAHLQHRIARYMTKPPNPGKIRKAASAMFAGGQRLLNDVRSRPYVMAAMSEGWSIAKTFQRMQEEGVPVEQILNPPQPKSEPPGNANQDGGKQRGLLGTVSQAGRM